MSEIENEAPAVEPEAADPAAPADAAEPVAPEAPEVEGAEVEAEVEVELNADGIPAVAGELFGGPDASQAVHSVESEGIGFAGEEG